MTSPAPSHAGTTPGPRRCERCGAEMQERKCKIVCENCGCFADCSDP
ncbi:MAG TPA: hypothetical protein VF010_07075 [Methylomirabilota bacterium]|nr:hypothetical protein [Methylomirabilota bacterium]